MHRRDHSATPSSHAMTYMQVEKHHTVSGWGFAHAGEGPWTGIGLGCRLSTQSPVGTNRFQCGDMVDTLIWGQFGFELNPHACVVVCSPCTHVALLQRIANGRPHRVKSLRRLSHCKRMHYICSARKGFNPSWLLASCCNSPC